jgi:microcystin-dependent protein
MATPFMGEIKIIAFNFPPKGWTFCNGQLLPINQNQALFSILGTTYGGNGQTTFALPNLQGRTPLHTGDGIILGQAGGETSHTLNISEMPAHTHTPNAQSAAGNTNTADPTTGGARLLAQSAGFTGSPQVPFVANIYATGSPNTTMAPQSIVSTGGSQPHDNMSPYLVLYFIIALQGIFPSQN